MALTTEKEFVVIAKKSRPLGESRPVRFNRRKDELNQTPGIITGGKENN